MSQASLSLVSQACGKSYKDFLAVDAIQAEGGILTAWNPNTLSVENSMASRHQLTVDFVIRKDGSKFRLTNVYGPSNQIGRDAFLHEIRTLSPPNNTPWLICGDFNLTLQPEERTNRLYNQAGTADFAKLVDELQLIDLQMDGRSYTWSSHRMNPSMARLDRVLLNQSFASSYANIHHTSLANTSSDHCPLLCSFGFRFQPSNIFRLENFFLKIPEFTDLVLNYWLSEEVADNPNSFNIKLVGLTKIISGWRKGRLSSLDFQLQSIREYLEWIDKMS
ncbi:DNAse I-like superfamily protein [Rhynchospora pubera]|uniref:DNAse I-like superfamily protein n=1 Tax=Rhynchospora pubera TaxID=906938 RepID=A0AAV8BU73_9POAL|nr:DNAse I-like superfamily protein [Rhynchospora pubera]